MIIVALIIVGLCLGSFVNALVYRLHWQETHKKPAKAEQKKYSIKSGRSLCPNCRHELAAVDLIPVISWVTLGGKCRYCHQAISAQYPMVEILTALLFVFSYLLWPYSLESAQNIVAFIFWLVFLTGFMSLIIYDIKYLTLPNKVVFPLIVIAITGLIIESIAGSDIEILKTAAWGFVIGGGLFYVLFQLSAGKWIGGGDVKLGFLLGILVGGPAEAFLMLFLASLLGTIYSMPMILTKKLKAKSRIPFGPFLIIAAIIVQLFGAAIIDWYTTLAGGGY